MGTRAVDTDEYKEFVETGSTDVMKAYNDLGNAITAFSSGNGHPVSIKHVVLCVCGWLSGNTSANRPLATA